MFTHGDNVRNLVTPVDFHKLTGVTCSCAVELATGSRGRGVEMPSNLTDAGRALGHRKQADQSVADNWDLLADLFRLRAHGATLRDCARQSQRPRNQTRRGGLWTADPSHAALDRVAGRVEFVVQTYSKAAGTTSRVGSRDTKRPNRPWSSSIPKSSIGSKCT